MLSDFRAATIRPKRFAWTLRSLKLSRRGKGLTERQSRALQRWADKWCKHRGYTCGTLQAEWFDLERNYPGPTLRVWGWAVPDEWRISPATLDAKPGQPIYVPIVMRSPWEALG